jgi:hypothetical protein
MTRAAFEAAIGTTTPRPVLSVAPSSPTPSQLGPVVLILGWQGRWFVPPTGAPARLERYGPAKRILRALAEAHHARPGTPLSWRDLFAEGWPAQRAQAHAARNRVYVAVARLRSMGLRGVLVSSEGGYLLSTAASVTWSSAVHPPAP